ncbi:MAG TPA: ATP-binding protein, partial [Rhodospirillales bacterium]|nr:ATP-binding protein [Rhodospirillales bacterium]
LSLIPVKKAGDVSQDFQRRLYRTLADVAFDFSAIFFARRGGGGDMIFGVEKTRTHDVLRAVRAATAVATDIAAREGGKVTLRGGLSSGVVMASMNRLGAWSGEAIAGAVIATTRELCAQAKPGKLALGEPALKLIRFLGADHRGQALKTVPLTNPFQWRLCGRNLETPLRGRVNEMKTLVDHLARLAEGKGGVILLEGESGIGKSALLWSFTDRCADYEISVWMRSCPAPDSQPAASIAGCLIEPGSRRSVPVTDFKKSLIDSPPTKPTVIIVDDTHLLPKKAMSELSSILTKMAKAPILFILAGRGRGQLPGKIRTGATAIRLKRLEKKSITEILKDLHAGAAKEKSKICAMAAGVPVFTVEMTRHLLDQGSKKTAGKESDPGHELPLPLCLLSLVIARIDTFELDRHLLRLAAKIQGEQSRDDFLRDWLGNEDDLASALDKAVKAGLLQRTPPLNGKKETFGFRHPMVHAVVSFALKDYGQAQE